MTKGSWKVSIRAIMLLSLLLMTLAALMVIIHMSHGKYLDNLREAKSDTARLTYGLAAEFRVLVNSARELGETLAMLPDGRNPDAGKVEPLLKSLIDQNPVYANIVMLDHIGQAWASGVPLHGKVFSMADRRYFKSVMATGVFSAGEYTMGKTTSKPVLSFGCPIRNVDGTLMGCIAIGFNLEYFKTTFQNAELPPNSIFTFIDHKGIILYTSYSPETNIGKPYLPDEFKAMQTKAVDRTFVGEGVDGLRRIISFTDLRLNDSEPPYLYIKVSIPFAPVAENIRKQLAIHISTIVAAIFVLTALIWYLGRRFILAPIAVVNDALVKVAEGDLAVRLSGRVHVRELKQIESTFDTMISALSENIGERQKAEESLQRHGEFLWTLLETIPSPVFYKDTAGKYTGCNKAFEEFLGLRRNDIIGKTVFDIAPRETAEIYHQKDQELLSNPGKQIYEWQVKRKDSETRHVIFYKATLMGARNQIAGIVGLISDITERKHVEEEREKLKDQLLHAQKLESIGRLAGGVAHDFNNMLMVISGNIELVLEQIDPAQPMHDNLMEALDSARRSADLTRQLLAFARRQAIAPQLLSFNEMVTGMLKMLRRLIGENIDLVWKPGPNLWPVRMDPTQIDQILANLAVNARDAIEGVGNLTIETDNIIIDETYCMSHEGFIPGEYVLLAVSDNGRGMDQETLAHLFEPFYTTKEMGKGTGMGLATIYGIVKQNDGFINVYSEPGKGTSFKIYFRRAKLQSQPVQVEKIRQAPQGGAETIMLVEDEEGILRLGRTILESYGYRVLATQAPGEALTISQQHQGPIHLLITDVIMPQMNGKDLQTRMQTRHPGLKTLFMSGYTADTISNHGILEEGIHFLQKPFSALTLATKVREVLNGSD